MNQILIPESPPKGNHIPSSKKDIHSNISKIYKIQFLIFSFTAIILLISLFIRIYQQNEKENTSKKLMNIYKLSTLYAESTNPATDQFIRTSNNNNQSPFVIGMIRINKISLNYPILSESNSELLKLSLCRFAGPMPNEVGNLCIAGHNYVDYKLFSRLHELELNDKIEIYDLSGKMVEYFVIQKYETKSNDTSCTSQNTNGKNIITLLTCNNVSGKRLVVIAKPI